MQILLGCLVAVVSSAAQSLGLTLQRKAHLNEPAGYSQSASLWWTGVVLFVSANLFGSSVQLVALPLIILCPLQAIGLVFNSIYASLLLEEPFTIMSTIGTGLVVVGACLIAMLGAQPDPKQSLDELLKLFGRASFLIWMAFTLIAALGLWFNAKRRHNKGSVRGTSYGILSGILSAHSLFMAKSAVELVVRAMHHGPSDLLRPAFWIIIAVFLTFAISQLYFASAGLRYCSTSIFYPLVFCVYNVVSMVNGLVYFDAPDRVQGAQIFWVASGTLVLLFGVLLLSLPSGSSASDLPCQLSGQPTQRTPLLVNTHYTSLDDLNPAIASPDSPLVSKGRRKQGFRALSKEQTQILRELEQV